MNSAAGMNAAAAATGMSAAAATGMSAAAAAMRCKPYALAKRGFIFFIEDVEGR